MKKIFAVAALGLFSQFASAQSSVTLYGIISEGVQWVSNAGGHSVVKPTNGTLQNSRWGFRGAEDLGGGLKAVFTLENGFDITNGKLGQGGRLFGRQAFVGLSSAQYGTVTMGRQYDFFFENMSQFEASSAANSFAAHVGDSENGFGGFRYNNSIKYASPIYRGLGVQGMYAMSNTADGFAVNRAVSFGLTYKHDALRFAAAFSNLNLPGTGTAGAVTDDYTSSPFVLFRSSPLNSSVGVDRQRNFGLAGAYDFGNVTWNLYGSDVRYHYLDKTSLHLDTIDTSLQYRVSPFVTLAAAYVYTVGNYSGVPSNPSVHWNTAALSVDYLLSKRTDVYVFSDAMVASGPRAVAVLWSGTPSTSRSQIDVVAGIRHKF
jgi:predicted porin